MTLPDGVELIRVRGYLWAQSGSAVRRAVTFTPTATILTDTDEFGWVLTTSVRATLDAATGYWYADLLPTNHPDLTPFLQHVTLPHITPYRVEVPYDAPVTDVGGGLMMRAAWLQELASPAPVPLSTPTYYTGAQTDAHITTHNSAGDAHADIRALIAGGDGGGAVASVNGHTGVVVLAKSDVGLGSVDNTADSAKPVSTAQASAIGVKADTSALTAHTGNVSNPHSVTAAQVGLGNVTNTSDVNKPVSTAQQTALDAKAADNAVVHNTGNEAVGGTKTFSASPSVPDTPATGSSATNQNYVLSVVGGASVPTVTSVEEGRGLAVIGGVYAATVDPVRLPMKRFRQALAAIETTPLNWWALGDSITEGKFATALDGGYVYRLARAYQKQATSNGRGGFGYLNTYSSFYSGSGGSTNYWTFSGGGAGGAVGATATLFGSRKYTFATDETATLTFTGTSFKLHHRVGDASSTAFTVAIDGGSPTTVTPSTTGGLHYTGVYTSATLLRGTHTVVLTPSAGTVLPVVGATLFDGDETAGIRCYNHALSGQRATQYAAGMGASFIDQAAVASNPALVTIMLGTNDYTVATTQATFTTSLQTIITNVKAACTITPSFLILIPEENFLASPTLPWSTYINGAKAVAAADPTNVAVVNLADHFIDVPTAGNNYTQGLFNSDQAHPADAGHRFIAQLALNATLGAARPLHAGVVSSGALADANRMAATAQTGTTYTLVAGDAGTAVECSNASAQTVTVPPNSSVPFGIGTLIEVVQIGAGQVTVAAGVGVTLRSAGSLLNTRTQYSAVSLRKRGTDDWVVVGDLA